MSKAIYRGTTLDGSAERQVMLYEVDDRLVVAIADGDTRIVDAASLDLDMADALAASMEDRVTDIRMEQEAAR